MVNCYDVLQAYLKGDSRKNELYIAKYMDVFLGQLSYEVYGLMEFAVGLLLLVSKGPRFVYVIPQTITCDPSVSRSLIQYRQISI